MHLPTSGPQLRHESTDLQEESPEDRDYLAAQAVRCRRLARTIGDSKTVETLARMADEYEARVTGLRR